MSDIVERRYNKDRNPMELEPWFSKHMSSMTGEDLHSKADIAQELAYRDQQIESLRQQLAECQSQNNNFRHLLRELWRQQDPDDWDDEFAAEVSTACK